VVVLYVYVSILQGLSNEISHLIKTQKETRVLQFGVLHGYM